MSTSLTHHQPPGRQEKQQAMRALIRRIAHQLVEEALREQREAPVTPTATRQSRKGK